MIYALILFIVTYILMLAFQKQRPWIALFSAVSFIILGMLGVFGKKFGFVEAITAVDYNVLLMIAGTMGIVVLFIESKMPALIADFLISKVPNVKWAVAVLALFAGIISALVDNVATVLMVAPIGLSIAKKLKISPVPMIIAIAVSSNLQGAATLVGDTTSMLLASAAGMNFLEFFWMDGKAGIFFAVELGALASLLILLVLFRKDKQKIESKIETKVEDLFPTFLIIGAILLLIVASFIQAPTTNKFLISIYNIRSGLICALCCLIGMIRTCIKEKSPNVFKRIWNDLDKDTLLLLFGLFMVIEGIKTAGVIDEVASLFGKFAGSNPFTLYVLIVVVSVILSAFVDNIPYVMTMLPVVATLSLNMGLSPNVFYFGLLIGATLGGNLTPIGASANIAAIGILRKNGETVKAKDFLRIGVPFTLAAVLVGSVFIWLVWGI